MSRQYLPLSLKRVSATQAVECKKTTIRRNFIYTDKGPYYSFTFQVSLPVETMKVDLLQYRTTPVLQLMGVVQISPIHRPDVSPASKKRKAKVIVIDDSSDDDDSNEAGPSNSTATALLQKRVKFLEVSRMGR